MRRTLTRAGWVLLVTLLAMSRSAELRLAEGRSIAHTRADPAKRWNRFYARIDLDDPRWQPNALLMEVAAGLEPGRALDVGIGQGRNALYLAELGWQVTGFDISKRALDLVRRSARERGVEIEVHEANVWDYQFGTARWDLIVCSYMGDAVLERADDITAALAPGGTLVAEMFLHSDELVAEGRPKLGYETGALRDAYSELDVLRYEEVDAPADWWPGEVVPIVRLVARKR